MPSDPDSARAGYAEVTIEADPSLLEELSGVLSQLGFEGFWEEENTLRCYMQENRWEPGLLAEVEAVVRLTARHADTPLPQVSFSTLPFDNWNERWERTIRPVRITDRIVVAPSWDPFSPSGDDIVITIDPKMSFGTGYHESTRLAARLCERFLGPGVTVLDVGTGTGILAIAAVRLGAGPVVAVDIDDWAYRNALENVAANDVKDQVEVLQGGPAIAPPGPYGMILANIQRSVILEMFPVLLSLLSENGILILAGLLDEEEGLIEKHCATAGLEILEKLGENGWISFAVRRGGRSGA